MSTFTLPISLIEYLDYIGVAVFAATGALAASRKQMDIIGFLFFASLTGMGGGTVRDLVLDTPVFWVSSSSYLAVCFGVAVVVYFTAHLIEYRYKLLLWLDAVGISAYCVMGANKGLELGAAPLVAIVMGVLTGTFGGVLRDVVSGEPSVLLRREIYISATLVGSALFVVMVRFDLPPTLCVLVSIILAFAIRAGALAFGWTLPGYRQRAGRPADRFFK